MLGYPHQPHEELSITDTEVGFSPGCVKGLQRVGVETLRDIFDMAERFHGGTVGYFSLETAKAYLEAVRHLHAKGWWPWPEDLAWFDAET